MTGLTTLSSTVGSDDICSLLDRDGACILSRVLSEDAVDDIVREVTPFVERTRGGRDDFSGQRTRRTGALIARSPQCRDVATHAGMLAAASQFLSPYTKRIQLHLTQTIFIGPGQGAQVLHRDRGAWGTYLPEELEPQFNTLWALSEFTTRNGATRIVPGSHRRPLVQEADEDAICQAEMKKGSVLIYSGSVLHSGGENRTQETRAGLNITYSLAWLRQEENQYLSCPPHVARDLPQDLQELLGYTMGSYALGYYSDPEANQGSNQNATGDAGPLPPERAVGARPRGRPSFA